MRKKGSLAVRKSFLGRKVALAALSLALAASAVGCTASQEEEENLVILDQGDDKTPYNLSIASYGDVRVEEEIRVIYSEGNGQSISFPISGKVIYGVYVEEGDYVEKGQLLAELVDSGYEEEIARLEYQIARNEELLEQTKVSEDYEISTQWLQYLYQSGQTPAEHEALEERVAQIQQDYEYAREDYQDAIDLDGMELQDIRQEAQSTRLYSGLNGTVSLVKPNLQGSLSVQDEEIIHIENGDDLYFKATQDVDLDLFEEGVPVTMVMGSKSKQREYQLLPDQMDRWEDPEFGVRFVWAGEPDGDVKAGDNGKITIVLEEKKNVLNIPASAVYEAEGKHYVYCLGEGNERQVKWIETGMVGGNRIEVISGLTEGERVILR